MSGPWLHTCRLGKVSITARMDTQDQQQQWTGMTTLSPKSPVVTDDRQVSCLGLRAQGLTLQKPLWQYKLVFTNVVEPVRCDKVTGRSRVEVGRPTHVCISREVKQLPKGASAPSVLGFSL